MKKIIFFAFLFLISANSSYGKCHYASCSWQVSSGKNSTKSSLKKDFERVKNELKILEDKYKIYLSSIKKNNISLDKKINILKRKAIKNKEIFFILSQNVNLQSIQNNKVFLNE